MVEEVWDPELGRHVFRTVEYVEKVVETEVYFSTLCVLYEFFTQCIKGLVPKGTC